MIKPMDPIGKGNGTSSVSGIQDLKLTATLNLGCLTPWTLVVIVWFFNLVACAAEAADLQQSPINTERPSFSNSGQTVGRSVVQIESGAGRQSGLGAGGDHETIVQTPVLLRVGVLPRAELRLGTDGYTWQTTGSRRVEGWGDSRAGLKWQLLDQNGKIPALGSITDVALPTGAPRIRGRGARPVWELPLDWKMADVSCTLMPGVVYDSTDGGARYAAPLTSFYVDYSWTSRFQTFVEEAGQQFAAPAFGGNVITTDLGATYLLTPNTQIDGAIWWGMNRDSPDAFYTAGLSLRL